MRQSIKFTYSDILMLCFCAGVVGGTVLANLLSQDIIGQAGYFGSAFSFGVKTGDGQRAELLAAVCRQRLFETGFAWLLGLTVFAVPCFYMLAGYLGFSAGVVLSITTCQKGLMGLFYYGAAMLPHFVLYIPVWCILAKWAGKSDGKIRLVTMAGLLVLVVIGAILETYVNPYVLNLLI